MEVVVTTWDIRRAKLQSNRHHQQTSTQHLWARCPSWLLFKCMLTLHCSWLLDCLQNDFGGLKLYYLHLSRTHIWTGTIDCITLLTEIMKNTLGETQTLCAGCSKAEPKIFDPLQTPFPGAPDGQILISWIWSLPSPTDPIWWRSMHAISSYSGNRPTNKHTDRTD